MPTIDGMDIPDSFINDHKHSFRLAVIGLDFVTRKDIITGLIEQLNIDKMDVEFIYQQKKGREWFVELK